MPTKTKSKMNSGAKKAKQAAKRVVAKGKSKLSAAKRATKATATKGKRGAKRVQARATRGGKRLIDQASAVLHDASAAVSKVAHDLVDSFKS